MWRLDLERSRSYSLDLSRGSFPNLHEEVEIVVTRSDGSTSTWTNQALSLPELKVSIENAEECTIRVKTLEASSPGSF